MQTKAPVMPYLLGTNTTSNAEAIDQFAFILIAEQYKHEIWLSFVWKRKCFCPWKLTKDIIKILTSNVGTQLDGNTNMSISSNMGQYQHVPAVSWSLTGAITVQRAILYNLWCKVIIICIYNQSKSSAWIKVFFFSLLCFRFCRWHC